MALKIDAKCERKPSCAFEIDIRNLANFDKLKNSDFILESKMKLNQNKNKKKTRSTRRSVKTFFYLRNK